VRIWKLLPGLEAAVSGLKKGDRIVEVNGKPVSDFESFTLAMKEPWETGRLSMKVERKDNEILSASLKGDAACGYRIAVIERDVVNAFADGKNVFVTTGMLRFLQSDDELAIVLGHEFAHNALAHLRQMRAQSLAGMLMDLAILVFGGVDTGGLFSQLGRLVYSKEFEADADYMGLYFTARAGYQIQVAPSLWRRMAVEHPGGIKDTSWLATHPSTPERAVSLRRTIEEIERKKAKGLPLLPEQFTGPAMGEFGKDYDGTVEVRDILTVSREGTEACRSGKPPPSRVTTYVFECDDNSSYVVRAKPGGAWIFRPQGSLYLPGAPEDTGNKYSAKGFEIHIKGETALIREPAGKPKQCLNNRRRAVWERAKLDGADFRAAGNEPGWVLLIMKGRITLNTDYGATRIEAPLPEPVTDQENRTTLWETAEFTVEISAKPCRDSMSEDEYESTVVVRLPGKTLYGCGKALH